MKDMTVGKSRRRIPGQKHRIHLPELPPDTGTHRSGKYGVCRKFRRFILIKSNSKSEGTAGKSGTERAYAPSACGVVRRRASTLCHRQKPDQLSETYPRRRTYGKPRRSHRKQHSRTLLRTAPRVSGYVHSDDNPQS